MATFSCVVIGNESLLVQCSEQLLERGNSISAVVTRNPDLRGWAKDRGLRVETPGKDLAERLGDVSFDWLLSIANLMVIPQDVLDLAAKGAINFHDGPLPKHAGLNAPVWALVEGETQHGITWHMIEGGVDEGDILVTRSFDISANDTALTLNTKAYEAAIQSFPDLLAQLEQDALKRLPQDLSQRTYHALADRPGGHGLLDFARPAAELARLVRALDHGPYWNPLCTPKFKAGSALYIARHAQITESHAPAGNVLDVTADHLTVACGEHAVVLSGLETLEGQAIDPKTVAQAGDQLPLIDAELLDLAGQASGRIAAHSGFWRERLAKLESVSLPGIKPVADATLCDVPLPLQIEQEGIAQIVALIGRVTGQSAFDVAVSNTDLAEISDASIVAPWVPVRIEMQGSLSEIRSDWEQSLSVMQKRVGFATDIAACAPELESLAPPAVGISYNGTPIVGTAMTIAFSEGVAGLHYDTTVLSEAEANLWAARINLVAAAPVAGAVVDMPVLPDSEKDAVLLGWNATEVERDQTLTMHRAFEAQVDKTPDAIALVFEGQSLSYADLNARANRAAHLLRSMGVEPGKVVGLCCRRSVDLMVGALAILKAGGAYLPMDPSYPADRLQHFVEDSAAPVIVTQAAVEASLPRHSADVLVLDAEPRLATAPVENLPDTATANDLAYLIYTSGSTGKPKGVMVEHGNVLNFYCGMDAVVPHSEGGTWLAVTSLSFDISVLELFWTTARGFKVVLTSDEDRGLISKGPMPLSDQGMEFSIYYWGNDDGVGRDKYGLLLDGAKFADENGFVAVWTPERHFHAFGGPYPNPSVTGAAVAGMTKNIGVRGGSVVAPLHHPARIAEEWSVIDNLTSGRAGMAIASGWQPDDFVLRPENTPPENKPAMIESIKTLRKLWAGEAVGFPRKDGTIHEVVTQPRPVSKELPVWVTTAGNPATWKEAGQLGCNVLTHLLGQSIDEVAGKIKIYHDALREAGHDPADFTVTLMLHTYLAETREKAREVARGPMKDYLNSAAGLIKQYAWAFPAFKRPEGATNAFDLQLDGLEPDELDAILDFAFERYFNDSGLFGTVEDALSRAEDLKRIGVSEIACLIDYGIDRETVLEGLKPLARVVQQANVAPELADDDFSIAAQIVRHKVTHMQCTPSMARMIAMNDEARFALSQLDHLFLGGEPLPGALVDEFAAITKASVTNMYGPTETTIWSSTETAVSDDAVVNIGLPLANQSLYVLDEDRKPVGVGQEGELWIGGQGVTRGYWNRPELTAERFQENPFHAGRIYRTGDLVRRRVDGRIDYVGRADHQVKLRGFRIELGEIEAVLESQSGVTQAVVMAREDVPGDLRLVGYYTGAAQNEADLKKAMGAALPTFMVPGRFVQLDSFPLTPNKKVDRKALPAPQAVKPAQAAPIVRAVVQPPANPKVGAPSADTADLANAISDIWSRFLGVQGISGRDNFFELGGHSLLAVQTHRAIREELGANRLSITDIFRFPVLSDLAERVATMVDAPKAPVPVASTGASVSETAPMNDRAQSRADAMARRRAMRARRSA